MFFQEIAPLQIIEMMYLPTFTYVCQMETSLFVGCSSYILWLVGTKVEDFYLVRERY